MMTTRLIALLLCALCASAEAQKERGDELQAVGAKSILSTYCATFLPPHFEGQDPQGNFWPGPVETMEFFACCSETPSYTQAEREECAGTLYDLIAEKHDEGECSPTFTPSLEMRMANQGTGGIRHGIVNGARQKRVLDSNSVAYTGNTNTLTGNVDFTMTGMAHTVKWRPEDIMRCYVVRTVDTATYTETAVRVLPGLATDASLPIIGTFSVKTSTGAEQIFDLPLVPNLVSSFEFGSNLVYMIVSNVNTFEIGVTAHVNAPFLISSGEEAGHEAYCTGSTTHLGTA